MYDGWIEGEVVVLWFSWPTGQQCIPHDSWLHIKVMKANNVGTLLLLLLIKQVRRHEIKGYRYTE